MVETLGVTDMLANRYEPKRKYRWIFQIEGIDAYLMKTAARPHITHEKITIDYINDKRWLAGKRSFDTVSVTMYDAISPSGAQQLMEWLRLTSEAVSGRDGYADFYKRNIQMKLLDPMGNVVELWDGRGAWVEDANFNDLDYSSSDAQDIALVIQADKWILQY